MSQHRNFLRLPILFLLLLLSMQTTAQVSETTLFEQQRYFTYISNADNFQPLIASDSLKAIVFLGQDSMPAPTANHMRLNMSTDFGSSWARQSNVLTSGTNPMMSRSRTGAFFNPAGNTNPYNARVTWRGFVDSQSNQFPHGTTDLSQSSNSPVVDSTTFGNYVYSMGGIVRGLPGEYWTLGLYGPNNIDLDSIKILKGAYNSGTMNFDWTEHVGFAIDTLMTLGAVGDYKIAFSPDGNIGYLVNWGDILGQGSDSSLVPIVRTSTDGGATWSARQEVDLNFPCLVDTLNNLGSGIPELGYDYDITVDMNGNLHFLSAVGNRLPGAGNIYAILPGWRKAIVDITTPDTGSTWRAIYLSGLDAFRGEFGVSPFNVITDNSPKISRNVDGSRIFYSWTDTDSTAWGTGFENIVPDLHTSALSLLDSTQAPVLNRTQGISPLEGNIILPYLAPEILTDTGGVDTFVMPMAHIRFNSSTSDVLYINGLTYDENDFAQAPLIMGMNACGPPCGSLCVWPGDANYDFIVDMDDLLSVSLSWGQTGPVRANASLNWVGQPGTLWADSLQGVNRMHQDCDGDGTVTWGDTLAITQNYNFTHNKSHGASSATAGANLQFDPRFDSLQIGQFGLIDIVLGDSVNTADSILGLIFDILYDPALVDTNSVFVRFDSCWLGTYQTNLVGLYKDFYFAGETHVGLSRTDLSDQSGHGVIATMGIVAIDNISGKREAASETLLLGFANVKAINHSGEIITVGAVSDSVSIWKDGLYRPEPNPLQAVRVWPNPTQSEIQVDLTGVKADGWRLIDAMGRVQRAETRALTGQQRLTLDGLPEGIYFLEIRAGTAATTKKIILQRY